jgi:4-amino-4-deoxy-L-arabinose transferase-like glycosyltransferase
VTILVEPPAGALTEHPTPRPARRPLWVRLVRARPEDPFWVRPSLLILLVSTGVAYVWALGDSGWANSFYSAAVQAGAKSWKAFFFGSSDPSNFITVDKPPASLWVMELSARVFGLNSWSILVPQALEGVGAVLVLYLTVRRWFSPAAALIAGAVMASTPVAVLMFRYNNPDALLTLLFVVAAYATVRAIETASTWWLVGATVAIGTAFITKELEAFLVLPAIGIVYLITAPTKLTRRLLQLVIAAAALVASSGWWVAAVMLTPAADRPYIGGSQDNSLFNVIFGYNGFGRLSGNEAGSVGGAGPVGSRWGPTGLIRLFQSDMGGQISWLLPAALILLVACLWFVGRAPRTDRTRAALLLFGGWMVLMGLVFSYAQGIIHPYYNVALAPPIAALVGIGTVMVWNRRERLVSRMIFAAVLAVTSIWSYVLLGRSPDWLPWLGTTVLVVGLATSVLVILSAVLGRKTWLVVGAAGLPVVLAGPFAYALNTANTPHSGAIPSAGPSLASGAGGFGFGRGGFPHFGPAGAGTGPGAFGAGPAGGPGLGALARLKLTPNQLKGVMQHLARLRGGFGAPPGHGFGGGGGPGGGFGARGAGPGGGFLDISTPGPALVKLLEAGARQYTWVAATVNSNSAAGYQLATGSAVMAIGGFNGSDPAPKLSQFERYVQEKKIHYFIAGGGVGFGTGGAGTAANQITDWVETHFTHETVDGTSLYDLAGPVTAPKA